MKKNGLWCLRYHDMKSGFRNTAESREVESFLPLYETQRQWKDGSKGALQLVLFPSYIFVHIGWTERVTVLQIPGVISIVGGGRDTAAIPDSYIHFLREGLRQGKIEPHPYLTAGARVRIHSGPMAGMEGVLLRRKNNYRVIVTLELIMKSVAVEVALTNIEPLPFSVSSSHTQFKSEQQRLSCMERKGST